MRALMAKSGAVPVPSPALRLDHTGARWALELAEGLSVHLPNLCFSSCMPVQQNGQQPEPSLHPRFCLKSCAAKFLILPRMCNGPRISANKRENAKKSKPADALGEAKSSDDLDGSQEPAF